MSYVSLYSLISVENYFTFPDASSGDTNFLDKVSRLAKSFFFHPLKIKMNNLFLFDWMSGRKIESIQVNKDRTAIKIERKVSFRNWFWSKKNVQKVIDVSFVDLKIALLNTRSDKKYVSLDNGNIELSKKLVQQLLKVDKKTDQVVEKTIEGCKIKDLTFTSGGLEIKTEAETEKTYKVSFDKLFTGKKTFKPEGSEEATAFSEELVSSLKDLSPFNKNINSARIKNLIGEYKGEGEDWKNEGHREWASLKLKSNTSRLRPPSVMRDTLDSLKEIERLQSEKNQLISTENNVLLQKKSVSLETEVITIGDIHGDAYSLATMLEKLQSEGKMDENFVLSPTIELVFLGDYVDRGPDSWAVLNLISRLKLNNMEHVHLIRGNHENTLLNYHQGGVFGDWYLPENADETSSLNAFYNSLPSALFIGVEEGGGEMYDIYTHGGVPLSFKLEESTFSEEHLLSKVDASSYMWDHADLLMECTLPENLKSCFDAEGNVKKAYRQNMGLKEWILEQKLALDEEGFLIDAIERPQILEGQLIEWMQTNKIRRFFKGHSHEQKEEAVDKGTRKVYFLDTDLYGKGVCLMHSHQMSAQVNDPATVYLRNFGETTFKEEGAIPTKKKV